MLELGKHSKKLHKSMAQTINMTEINKAHIIGNHIKETYKNVYIIENQSDLERFIKESRIGVELWKFFL